MQYGKSQEAIDRLTAEQRRVTQQAGTERPFTVTSPTVERSVNSTLCLAIVAGVFRRTISSRP
jgi:peptide methionine sulfoxide reductase MsrB